MWKYNQEHESQCTKTQTMNQQSTQEWLQPHTKVLTSN